MYNPITKTARYLRREYPFLAGMGAVGFGFGALVGTLVSLGTGTFFMIPIFAVGFGVIGVSAAAGGKPNRPDANTVTLNGVKLVGDKRDIASIAMTQRLISSYTENLQHLAELPKRTVRTIDAHVDDIRHHLARVRAYSEPDGKRVRSFSFTRQVIDAKGNRVEQAVANCDLPIGYPPLPLPIPKAPAPPAAPTGIPQPAALIKVPSPKPDFPGTIKTTATNANQPTAPANEAVMPKPQPVFKL
jgi:hypothetical protein